MHPCICPSTSEVSHWTSFSFYCLAACCAIKWLHIGGGEQETFGFVLRGTGLQSLLHVLIKSQLKTRHKFQTKNLHVTVLTVWNLVKIGENRWKNIFESWRCSFDFFRSQTIQWTTVVFTHFHTFRWPPSRVVSPLENAGFPRAEVQRPKACKYTSLGLGL